MAAPARHQPYGEPGSRERCDNTTVDMGILRLPWAINVRIDLRTVRLSQVLAQVRDDLPSLEREVLEKVWGTLDYDEDHIDQTELVSRLGYNLTWLLDSLEPGQDGRSPERLAEAMAVADGIGYRRALQGVGVEAVVRSWRVGERAIRERIIARADDLASPELLSAINRLGNLVADLTDRSVDRYRATRLEITSYYERLATDLVTQVLTGPGLTAYEVRERAQAMDLDLSSTYAAVAVEVVGNTDTAREFALRRHLLAELSSGASTRMLIGSFERRPLALIPTEPAEMEGLQRRLRTTVRRPFPLGEPLLFGISAGVAPLVDARGPAHQARTALEAGRRLGHKDDLVRFQDVAVEALLLQNPEPATLLLERIAPLRERPELIDTLRSYFRHGQSARAAARELFVHPNTVPLRLRTIHRLIQRDPDNLLNSADLVLALRYLDLVC